MTSEVKTMVDKVTDTVGGTMGKINASAVTSVDDFVENAAIGDMYEIAAARVALQRSQNPMVRGVARHMIADHTTSTHQLQAALEMRETQGITAPPTEMDSRRKTMVQHLEEAEDDKFDSTYLDQQVLAHEETSTLLRSFQERGVNAQLRSFAAGTLPVVERHLAQVKKVRADL